MQISQFTNRDIDTLSQVQPADWPDISPHMSFYARHNWCMPIKISENKELLGIGALIFFRNTAWLAHIIVNEKHRGKGIGSLIVTSLLDIAEERACQTLSLIATDLGYPVYKKFGFNTQESYAVYARQRVMEEHALSDHIIPYDMSYYDELLELDLKASGEPRAQLLDLSLQDVLLFRKGDRLEGAFFPNLGEGMIIAETSEAGVALLKKKCTKAEKLVLPESNSIAIRYLEDSSYKSVKTVARMVKGIPFEWQPQMFYSRIGGNLG